MRYNEFLEKWKIAKAEFSKKFGREPQNLSEFEEFVSLKVLKPRTRGLKSLRGLDL